MDEHTEQYQQLRTELVAAYTAKRWDGKHIDRIARKLISVGCQLARSREASAISRKHDVAPWRSARPK